MKKILSLLACLWLICRPVEAQLPFVCTGNFYLSLGEGSSTSIVYEVSINPNSGNVVFDPLPAGLTGIKLNSIGYRISDNFIYGVDPGRYMLFRIDASGAAQFLGPITGDFDTDLNFVAGDISPDGRFLVLLGGDNIDRQLVFIDLDSPAYTTTFINVENEATRCLDIAFDPATAELYGFDGNHTRLVKIDANSGDINTNFQTGSAANFMGAIFFDAFGNLFGYGSSGANNIQRTLFEINKESGSVGILATGPNASRNDGCSCPFTILFTKQVQPALAVPCTEVTYTFNFANASGQGRSGMTFEDVFPADFVITDIQNPFGGTISGGVGTNELTITGMDIPLGVNAMLVKLEILPDALGLYNNQASLRGLPEALGGFTLSDNPLTLIQNDSTSIMVHPLDVDFSSIDTDLCPGEVLSLMPSIYGVDYLWNDGSMEPVFTISEGGVYSVTVSSGCDVAIETITVTELDIFVDLGQDFEIELGDSLSLSATIFPSRNVSYNWTSSSSSLACNDCPQPGIRPFFDAGYHLMVADADGCTAEDSIFVHINKNRNIYIPTAFSPNGDGINDHFYVQSRSPEKVLFLRVFDRWGELVFERQNFFSNDSSAGWDGFFRAKPMPGASLLYWAEIEFLDGIVLPFTGSLLLVR